MFTKAEILQTAKDGKFGSVSEMRAKFESWQRFGLVGKAAGKERRIGGAGLWHPIQSALFTATLNNQAHGTRLTTVANLPVGLWLVGFEGIDTAQAQRAIFYWATRRALGSEPTPRRGERPTGPRSIREAALKAIVDQTAVEDTPAAARHRFLEQLRLQADGVSGSSSRVPADFVSAYLDVASPGSPSTSELRASADNAYYWVRFQVIGAQRLGSLCVDGKDVRAFWDWMRRYAGEDLVAGAKPSAPPEWTRSSAWSDDAVRALEAGLQRSCQYLLAYMGVGLRTLAGAPWREELLRPPRLKGVDLDTAWGEPDTLLDLIDEDRRGSESTKVEVAKQPPDLGK